MPPRSYPATKEPLDRTSMLSRKSRIGNSSQNAGLMAVPLHPTIDPRFGVPLQEVEEVAPGLAAPECDQQRNREDGNVYVPLDLMAELSAWMKSTVGAGDDWVFPASCRRESGACLR